MSCLVEKFSYYIDVNERDKKVLNKLQEREEHYTKNDVVYKQDESNDELYVVKEGWFVNFAYLSDGGRQLLNFHFPGDIIGTTTFPFEQNINGLIAITNGTLCPFPKSGMNEIFEETPSLAALIFSMGMQDNVVLTDRLKAIGRMDGERKIALLLLQIYTRLKLFHDKEIFEFDLPLSQELIGDALGITTVYVNRMLKSLQNDGLITLEKKRVTLKNIVALEEMCDFNDHYYKLDTSWYPKN